MEREGVAGSRMVVMMPKRNGIDVMGLYKAPSEPLNELSKVASERFL